jgi:cbb3-type cytochrome oxidase subunit 3
MSESTCLNKISGGIERFWKQYRVLIMKMGIVVIGVPLLFIVGSILFSVASFLLSLLLFLLVGFFLLGMAIMLWSYVEEYFDKERNSHTIVLDGEIVDYRDISDKDVK